MAIRPIVKYGDPSGRVHTYRVSYTTIVSNTQMWPLGATAVRSLTLQTCWTWDGSRDFIVRALEISVAELDTAVLATEGPGALAGTEQSLGGEDFAWYLDTVPGAATAVAVMVPDKSMFT